MPAAQAWLSVSTALCLYFAISGSGAGLHIRLVLISGQQLSEVACHHPEPTYRPYIVPGLGPTAACEVSKKA